MYSCKTRLLIALVAAVLLVPWPDHHVRPAHISSISSSRRLAVAQRLNLSNFQLEVHVKAAAAAHSVHQDLLQLVGQTEGKRRSLGKATGSAAGSFSSVEGMQELQLAFYTLSASPLIYNSYNTAQTPAGVDLTPRVRDQGSCSTSVAFAVAAAAEAALGAALRKDAAAVEIDAEYLHYCSGGGRMCNSSWSIEAALEYVANQAPDALRPATCSKAYNNTGSSVAGTTDMQDNSSSVHSSSARRPSNSSNWSFTNSSSGSSSSSNSNTSSSVSMVASTVRSHYMCSAGQDHCSNITRETPWLKCSYRPLKSFWQIQQHIRNYGAVVTPMAIYSDYVQHFNNSSKYSASYSAYESNATARLLHGQAVVIVGYDNLEQSWTVLNSWGSGATASRKGGVTADGLVRVKMGAAGVGTPGETYGLECVPAAGSRDDPHFTAAYRRPSLRPVSLPAGVSVSNLHQRCYLYTTTARDTLASIADDFNISLVTVALDNRSRLKVKPIQFSFPYPQSLEELTGKLSSVVSTTNKLAFMAPLQHGYFRPYFRCMLMGDFKETKCTEHNLTACYDVVGPTRKINRGCTLVYPDLALREQSFKRGQQLKICNISSSSRMPDRFERVAYFVSPEVTQPRAVLALLEALLVVEGARQYVIPPSSRYGNKSYCLPENYNSSWQAPEAPVRLWSTNTTRFACDREGYATHLVLNFTAAAQHVRLDSPQVVQALLALERLQTLQVLGARGALPPQLGALKELRQLSIRYTCLSGQLPPNYGLDWQDMHSLAITPINQQAAQHLPTPTTNNSASRLSNSTVGAAAMEQSCRLQGPIPTDWGINLSKSLKKLMLSGNQLSGTLPPQLGLLGNLCILDLSNNKLSGPLPAVWATTGMFRNCSQLTGKTNSTKPKVIDISGNQLEGRIPEGWANMGVSKLQISNNPGLHGCLESMGGSHHTVVEFTNTSIEGGCPTGFDRYELERQQHDAIMQLLPQLFVAPNGSKFIQDLSRQTPANLSGWVHDSIRGVSTSSITDPATRARFSVTVAKNDRTAYVTHISATRVGLNLSVLPTLVDKLPKLQSFAVRRCPARGDQAPLSAPQTSAGLSSAGAQKVVDVAPPAPLNRSAAATDSYTLPLALARNAPASLKTLTFISCHIQGSLPEAWGNWSTLEELWLSDNQVTGSLPNSWAKMSSLKIMYADGNQFVGLLPSDWGMSSIPERILMNLNANPSIFGTVPSSWDRFKGLIWLKGTNVKGCIPAGMVDNVITDDTFDRGDIACPSLVSAVPQPIKSPVDDHQMIALLGIKGLLGKGALPSWSEDVAQVEDGTPAYCNSWLGVSCNKDHNVISLNLAAVATPNGSVEFSDVHQHLKSLPAVKYLHLAKLNLSGTLAEGLATVLPGLQHLNISGNPGITGSLPKWWAGLSDIEALDVSGCKLQGSLPESWAALQQLQTFKAANTELAGQLPLSWALLRNLRVLDVSHAKLTGRLPSQWADTAVMQTAGAGTAAQVTPAAAAAAVTAGHKGQKKGLGVVPLPVVQRSRIAPNSAQRPNIVMLMHQRSLLEPVEHGIGTAGSGERENNSSNPKVAVAVAASKAAAAPTRAAQAAAAAPLAADGQGGTAGPVVSGFKQMQAAAVAAGRAAEPLQLVVGGSDQRAGRTPSQAAAEATTTASKLASDSEPVQGSGTTGSADRPTAQTSTAVVSNSSTVVVLTTKTAHHRSPAPTAALALQHNSAISFVVSSKTQEANSTQSNGSTRATATTPAVPGSASGKAGTVAPAPLAANRTRRSKLHSTAAGDLTPGSSIANVGVNTLPLVANFSVNTLSLSGGLGMLQLEELHLAGNQLTGTLPDAYAALTRLRLVDLGGNEFNGKLPLQWAALHNLERLCLANNQLTGTLPMFWARLSSLESLDVSGNELRGPLPPAWVGMRNVELLNVSHNHLTGEIPKEWLVLAGRDYKLRCLLLYSNELDQASVAAVKRMFEVTSDSRLSLVTQSGTNSSCSLA